MAYWLWEYDESAPARSKSPGRLLWQNNVDEGLSYQYTEMAVYMGAYASKYPEVIRPTVDMLYRMGGNPRIEPSVPAVEALAKLAAADVVDTESLVSELALVLDRATSRRQLLATNGLIILKLTGDISLSSFVNRFRQMLVVDPNQRQVHSRGTASIPDRITRARRGHAVEALALIEATESVSIFDESQDIASLIKQQEWGQIAALAIATVVSPDMVPEPGLNGDVTFTSLELLSGSLDNPRVHIEERKPHGVWEPVRDAITEYAGNGSREFRVAAAVLFMLISVRDPEKVDLGSVVTEVDNIKSIIEPETNI
ncbi:hypothetical protein ACFQL1_23875 [Halomicroarcula sp. GCM10025709]|uniref:hypothetical protein n=1 Tax=Haloarcula TaxID=2237 RepID=UPI0024C3355B|nr:hypothetical protein [Halomicroarcula sp. YJ-61-S]